MQEAQQRPDRDGPHGPGRLSLLVVDSLSFLVSPVMGPGGTDDGHALMICLGRALKQLSQRHKLAVLTTNHIVGGDSSPLQPPSAAYLCRDIM